MRQTVIIYLLQDGSMTLEFYEEDTSGSQKKMLKKFYNKTQNEVHAIKYDPKWEDLK